LKIILEERDGDFSYSTEEVETARSKISGAYLIRESLVYFVSGLFCSQERIVGGLMGLKRGRGTVVRFPSAT